MLFTAEDVVGRSLCDKDGQTVGRITGFYRYPADLGAPWGVAAVKGRRIIRSTHLVDLQDALLDGDVVVVAYPINLINAAPNYEPMIGDTLSDGHAAEVFQHYRASMAPA